MRRVVAVVAALASSGCLSVPLDGRPCPCDESRGWYCDPRSSLCEPVADGVCGIAGAAASRVVIEGAHVAWRTDRSMEVAWGLGAGAGVEVDHYEITIATSLEDARTRTGSARVFGGPDDREHPELSRSRLPGTGRGDVVDNVVLRDLEPETRYFVQLHVFDVEGGVQCAPTLQALTYVPATDRLVVYDEERFGSGTLPECVEHVEDPALASRGTAFARYQAQCHSTAGGGEARCTVPDTPAASCFENVRLRDLAAGPIAIAPGPFEDIAHLSVDVALDDSGAAYWAEIALLTYAPTLDDDPSALPGPFYHWVGEAQTLVGDGRYRTYGVPLQGMRMVCYDAQRVEEERRIAADPSAPRQCGQRLLQPEHLLHGVAGVRVGATLDHLGVIRVDRAVVRY